MEISRLDHFVLTTARLEECLRFYTDILGMELRRENGRYALFFGAAKINIHTRPAEFLPAAKDPRPGRWISASSSVPRSKSSCGNSKPEASPPKPALSPATARAAPCGVSTCATRTAISSSFAAMPTTINSSQEKSKRAKKAKIRKTRAQSQRIDNENRSAKRNIALQTCFSQSRLIPSGTPP